MLRKIVTYLREDEYQRFMTGYNNSLHRKISAYSRNLLLGKPVKTVYRNQSVDDLVEMGVGLRKDMKAFLSTATLDPIEQQTLATKIASIEENLIKLIDICKQK